MASQPDASPGRVSSGTRAAKPVKPAKAAEATMLYLQKQVELAVRSHLDDLLKPADITALQYTALTVLERHPDLTSAQLARQSFVTTLGLSYRRALIRRYRGKVKDLERRMLSGLTGQQVEELRRYLYACRVALSGGPPH